MGIRTVVPLLIAEPKVDSNVKIGALVALRWLNFERMGFNMDISKMGKNGKHGHRL